MIPALAVAGAAPAWFMYAGVGAVGLGLLVVAVLMVPRKESLTVEARVLRYSTAAAGGLAGTGGRGAAANDGENPLRVAKGAAAGMLRRNQGLEAKIALRLDAAGSSFKAPEWLLLHSAIFVGAGLVGLVLGHGNLIIGLVFMALGLIGPWFFLGWLRGRRRKAFNAALPDTLSLMSGSLAAGLSLAQSVDTIVREGVEPISSEFRRVLMEARLGVSLESSLSGIAERFESKDFAWTVMAINIQRQVGGNLAELLDTVAATMREREYIRRQVAALAAEGKLSAWVLGGLPPAFMLYLLATNRAYVMVMFTTPLGWLMLVGAAMLLGVGVFWMSRLVKVEV